MTIIELLSIEAREPQCLHCQLRDTLNDYYRRKNDMHGDRVVLDVGHALNHLSMLVGELLSSGPTDVDRDAALQAVGEMIIDHMEHLLKIGAQPEGVRLS